MKRFLSILLVMLLVFPFALAFADAEEEPVFVQNPVEGGEEIEGIATPALDMSLEEYYQENGSLPGELTEALEQSEPFVPDDLSVAEPDDKSIIGSDDRIKVKDAKKYPYSAIGYMKVHARCGCTWEGSCFMVSKKCAMTAAHCLVCVDHGKTADKIDFYFGYRKGGYVYHYKKNFHYWYGTDFGNGRGSYGDYTSWDYGYIMFESKVGNKTGWFGVRCPSDSELESEYYQVCGYRNGDMRKDYTYADPIDQYEFMHWADTKGGYSGCPVFDEDYYVVGINICETSFANFARRYTVDLYHNMDSVGAFG